MRVAGSDIVELIELHGAAAMHEPHVKHLEGRLWEMRMKGKDGIARAIYLTAERDRLSLEPVAVRKKRARSASASY